MLRLISVKKFFFQINAFTPNPRLLEFRKISFFLQLEKLFIHKWAIEKRMIK